MHKSIALLVTFPLLVACNQRATPDQAASAAGPSSAAGSSSASSPKGASAGTALRLRLLNGKPGEFGISDPGVVWAVAMDMGLGSPGEVATVTALADGNASLYTTGSFGIIGGFAHSRVHAAAVHACATAEKVVATATSAKTFPYPEPAHIRFYLLTPSGVRTAEATEDELVSGKHPLAELFSGMNNVLTELRAVAEAGEAG